MSDKIAELEEYDRRLRQRRRTIVVDEAEACFIRAAVNDHLRTERHCLADLEDDDNPRLQHIGITPERREDLILSTRKSIQILEGIISKLKYGEDGSFE
jgi:hypothetical protein